MMTKQDLMEKRHNTDQLRQNSSLSPLHAEQLGQSIASSWQRSSSAEIPKNRLAAPLTDLKKTISSSTLAQALQHCAQDLKQIGRATSELQSRENLVCRLLLEKKKWMPCIPSATSCTAK